MTEQEARIALLEHFRSATQHWATVLVALAIAFFSVLEFKCQLDRLFGWLGAADFLTFFVLVQAAYGTYRMVINGWLGDKVVDAETTLTDEDKGSTCFVRLYNAIVNRILKKKGYGFWLFLFRWKGWMVCTIVSSAHLLLHAIRLILSF